jgi:hypothetical protein
MSVYIVEEVDEMAIYVNGSVEFEWHNIAYSNNQRKRLKKVLNQMKNIWFETYKQMLFISDVIDVNEFMKNIYKLFFMTYKYNIGYYDTQNIMTRKKNNYKNKKLLKIKNSIRI